MVFGNNGPSVSAAEKGGQVCEWKSCQERFTSLVELIGHVNLAHLYSTSTDTTEHALQVNPGRARTAEGNPLTTAKPVGIFQQADAERAKALDMCPLTTTKPHLEYSEMNASQLNRLGVKRGLLEFTPLLDESVARINDSTKSEILRLRDHIEEIYQTIDSQAAPSIYPKPVLDAIMFSLARLVKDKKQGTAVVLLPNLQIGLPQGTVIKNPETGFGLCLSGHMDHCAVLYDDVQERRDFILLLGSQRQQILQSFARRCLFLVEYSQLKPGLMSDAIPEAASRAVGLLKTIPNLKEVRFAFTNAETWYFLVLKEEGGQLICYQSTTFTLKDMFSPISLKVLQRIMVLLTEWLNESPISCFYGLRREVLDSFPYTGIAE